MVEGQPMDFESARLYDYRNKVVEETVKTSLLKVTPNLDVERAYPHLFPKDGAKTNFKKEDKEIHEAIKDAYKAFMDLDCPKTAMEFASEIEDEILWNRGEGGFSALAAITSRSVSKADDLSYNGELNMQQEQLAGNNKILGIIPKPSFLP